MNLYDVFEELNKLDESKNTDLLKNWRAFLTDLIYMSESEVVKELNLQPGEITNKAPMYIMSNGDIVNASGILNSKEDSVHLDILTKAFILKYNLSREDIYKLTDKQFHRFSTDGFDAIDWFIYNLDWVKINSGTNLENGFPCIILPRHELSYGQHATLKDFLYRLKEYDAKPVSIYPFYDNTDTQTYDLKKVDAEYIMDRIDCYYRTGELLENK